jgi:hypothetical protein
VGPVKISLKIPGLTKARATEDNQVVKLTQIEGGVMLELPVLKVHQLIILE